MSKPAKTNDLTLLILDTSDLKKLDLLNKVNWHYVENINAIQEKDDIDDSMEQIREYYEENN